MLSCKSCINQINLLLGSKQLDALRNDLNIICYLPELARKRTLQRLVPFQLALD